MSYYFFAGFAPHAAFIKGILEIIDNKSAEPGNTLRPN